MTETVNWRITRDGDGWRATCERMSPPLIVTGFASSTAAGVFVATLTALFLNGQAERAGAGRSADAIMADAIARAVQGKPSA